MGKCKRRTLNKQILSSSLSRKEALEDVISKIRENKLDTNTKNLLTLFGITPEELTEAGASYEEVLILKRYIF